MNTLSLEDDLKKVNEYVCYEFEDLFEELETIREWVDGNPYLRMVDRSNVNSTFLKSLEKDKNPSYSNFDHLVVKYGAQTILVLKNKKILSDENISFGVSGVLHVSYSTRPNNDNNNCSFKLFISWPVVAVLAMTYYLVH